MFRSEVKRLVRHYVPGDPPADRLAQTLVWVLYANGDLKKRHRCPHGKRGMEATSLPGWCVSAPPPRIHVTVRRP